MCINNTNTKSHMKCDQSRFLIPKALAPKTRLSLTTLHIFDGVFFGFSYSYTHFCWKLRRGYSAFSWWYKRPCIRWNQIIVKFKISRSSRKKFKNISKKKNSKNSIKCLRYGEGQSWFIFHVDFIFFCQSNHEKFCENI